ncbi:hypothetical protein AAHN97_11350 [Chitinophaga niabensis]|uniref:hypothetical protein n=1 Tax=Chitinophaga niabensis TaxID=536979 RepID=UPI0031BBB0CC
MEFIGFINECDRNIRSARPFKEMFVTSNVDEEARKKFIEYLAKGQFFGGVMTYMRDLIDGEDIGPMNYYTDGKYIWPVYYLFYLKKYPSFCVSSEMIAYLETVDYSFRELDNQELGKIDIIFANEWTGRYGTEK